MANPQRENGHTEIAHEVMEELLQFDLNGTEIKIILFVLRKTWGWGKKEDSISLSQFCEALSCTKPTVCKAVKKLLLVKILLLVRNGDSKNASNVYSFNKNYDEWSEVVTKHELVKVRKSTSNDLEIQLVTKPLHTKETSTKEILQKKTLSAFEEFWNTYPVKKSKKKALAIFSKIDPLQYPLILAAIEAQKTERRAFQELGKFCPQWKHPTTWLIKSVGLMKSKKRQSKYLLKIKIELQKRTLKNSLIHKLMIDLLNHVFDIDRKQIQKYAGIKFVIQECIPDKCSHLNHPVDRAKQQNGRCTWYEEVMLVDNIEFEKKGQFGRLETITLSVPIRWWNFLLACYKISLQGKPLTELELIGKASEYVFDNCFEIGGKPKNMAKKLGFSSYSKLLKTLK